MSRDTFFENGVEMVGPGYSLAAYEEETNPGNYPIALLMRFKSVEDKERFLSGLCDAWGENYCDLNWKWREGETLDTAESLNIDVFGDEEEETE